MIGYRPKPNSTIASLCINFGLILPTSQNFTGYFCQTHLVPYYWDTLQEYPKVADRMLAGKGIFN